jgi:hypothetical protein
MNTIISSEIKSTTEQQPLTKGELDILKSIRNKKLFYILSSYIALVTVLLNAWEKDWFNILFIKKEDLTKFGRFGPYFTLLLFLLLTIFFVSFYFKAAHPFIKDIRKGMKEIIYFKPEIYKTPFFEEYFIITPIKKKQRIKINTDLYNNILRTDLALILLAPHSFFVFEVEVGNKEMTFNETNEPLDI